jgi:choline-sulfatase
MRSYMTDRWEERGLYTAFLEDYAERNRARAGRPPAHLTRPSPLPVAEYLDSYVGRTAAEFVEAYEDSRPLCLFVGFPGPHEPWDAPGEYAAMYEPGAMPDPIPVPEGTARLPEDVKARPDLGTTAGLDPRTIKAIRASYCGKISLIDHWVGEILHAYDRRGRLDDLCVVFWSDHGEMAGDHGRLYKSTFHESSVRVPLIVRCPDRLPAGQVSDVPAEIVDIAPTVLRMAGVEASHRLLGQSLLSAAGDSASRDRDEQLSEIAHGDTRNLMLRTASHKIVMDHCGAVFMLFDLTDDPMEQHNLAGRTEAAGLEKDMRERLFRRLLAAQDCM